MSAAHYIEDEPATSVWHRLIRLFWVMLLLTIMVIVIGAFLPEMRRQRADQAAREELRAEIAKAKQKNERYKREFNWLSNNPEYMEIMARERFGMMKPGESIYRMDEAKTKPPPAPVERLGASPAPSAGARGEKAGR